MKVLIPHKDALFTLAKEAKYYLNLFNKENKKNFFFPQFPLWAPLPENEGLENGKIYGMTIFSPIFTELDFYFPIELGLNEKKIAARITFAKKNASAFTNQENLSFEKVRDLAKEDKNFPLKQKSFRLATALFEDNGWQTIDEKWVKVLGSPSLLEKQHH